LRANGITLFKVREETIKLLGKGERFFFSPEHPPPTEAAQRALDWAVDQKLKSGKLLLIGCSCRWCYPFYILEFHSCMFCEYTLSFAIQYTQKWNTWMVR